MKAKLTRAAAAAAIVLLNANVAVGSAKQQVGAYDFTYMSSGSLRATPVQVFDDGRNTYFQFRAGEAIPAIFAQNNGVMKLLVPTHEGPYIKVPEVHGQFTLQLGRAQAMVVHGGGTRLDVPPIEQLAENGVATPYSGGPVRPGSRLVASLAPSIPALVDDAQDRNSYATPVRGDRVAWVAPEASVTEHTIWFPKGSHVLGPQGRKLLAAIATRVAPGDHLEVVGRDDETLKEGLDQARANSLRDALVKAGVSAEAITTRVAVAGKRDKNLWESNVRVSAQAKMRDARQPATQTRAMDANHANIQALVRSGVLTVEQGNAMLRRQATQAAIESRNVTTLTPPTVMHPAVPPGGFRMLATDKTVQGTVRRWAAAVGHTIVWEVPPELDAQVSGDAAIQATSIKEAIERLLSGLRQAGYALDATVYSNRVIRFTVAGVRQDAAPSTSSPATNTTSPHASRAAAVHTRAAQPNVPQAESMGAFGHDGPVRKWSMRADDKSLEQMLNRWAREANWSVVWNARESVPIAGDALVDQPTFLAAADFVLAQVASVGYRMKAAAYANNTLVVSSY